MACPQCLKPLESDSSNCPDCGIDADSTLIGSAPAPESPPSTVAEAEPASFEAAASPAIAAPETAAALAAFESPSLSEPAPISMSDSLINRVLDQKYKLLELLGSGSYGRVYRARRLNYESDVAIKILHTYLLDPDVRKRFYREAKATFKLSKHENIVRMVDFVDGAANQSLVYIVMELLEGKPLNMILRDERLIEPRRAVSLMCDVCDGVGFAHSQEVIHRDLKPHNIVVLPAGSGRKSETVKIVDFGLAKLRRTELSLADASITLIGMMFGTPLYMSPEAWRGGSVDARSDIYSLGATMYHMLSGRPPFQGNNLPDLQRRHEEENPPPLAGDETLGLKPLERVVMRALEKDPDKRQQTAREFAEELQAALEVTPAPAPSPVTLQLTPFTFKVAQVDAHAKVGEPIERRALCFKERIDSETLEMVEIPEGKYTRGSPPGEWGRHDDESPECEVTVPPFFMSKYEITQAQWREVASFDKVDVELDPDPSYVRGDKKPVERVSWYDAVEFCKRLSRHTGREYRLPTEAEWEYACRAGMKAPFCFGDNISWELVNHNAHHPYRPGNPKGTFRSITTVVGSLGFANNFGLYDMLGNVWEWCDDVYHRNYYDAPADGRARLGGDQLDRVVRGGSWSAPAKDCGSAARSCNPPNARNDDLGFRVVCSLASRTPHIPTPDPQSSFIQRLKRAIYDWRNWKASRRHVASGSVRQEPSKQINIFLFLPVTYVLLTLFTLDLSVPQVLHNFMEPLVWGLTMGAAQALILRRYITAPLWWILITMGATAACWLIYYGLGLPWELSWSYIWGSAGSYQLIDRSTTILVVVALRWFIIALAQWLLLRKLVTRAVLWPLFTLGAASICGLIIVSFSREAHRDTVFLAYTVSAGVLLGLLQGQCVINFRNKPQAQRDAKD